MGKTFIYGEAYGGKQQGMKDTYGPELRFVAFEVKIDDVWLNVPQACELTCDLGLDFVDWVEIPTTLEAIDEQRDLPSIQARRNGIVEDRPREGVVLRPPFEVTLSNGRRVIAKHKGEAFSERAVKEVDPSAREKMDAADLVAFEWVTFNRLEHVIDQLIAEREDKTIDIKDTGKVIKLMVEDVAREALGEIEDTPPLRKAIGQRAARLFKERLNGQLSTIH